MELVPQSLANLIRRALREREAHQAIFDLPLNKAWKGGSPDLDLSRRFHGDRASTVVGPAAGPHTQLAQNIALSVLAGARVIELKTVQINDRLVIPRPCIDATNVAFNVEWSQELRIPQSLEEYAKAALLLAALRRMDAIPENDTLLDLSVGYDLAGIQSESMRAFIGGMLDAQPIFDRLLAELPEELAAFKDLKPRPRLVDNVTLSTFHGCPADEIESIAQYMMEHYGLHVVVKLNPTLLGFDDVRAVLNDRLGYDELRLRKEAFDKDLHWAQAVEMIGRLRTVAQRVGVRFGVKLTNTMIVENHKTFFKDPEMYLSGQPLHVLATQLLGRLRATIPLVGAHGEPPIMYSFSAGIDQHNFVAAVAADLCPITVCTDLLRPGGYARLPKYLDQLEKALREAGVRDLDSFVVKKSDPVLAMRDVLDDAADLGRTRGTPIDEARLLGAAEAFAKGELTSIDDALVGLGDGAMALLVRPLWIHAAGTRNAMRYALETLDDERYAAPKNSKVPKKIGSHLALFDCVSCDKCIPVCPNDANFAYDVVPGAREAPSWVVSPSGLAATLVNRLPIEQKHQLATFVDACNACGNCDIFCPEDGGPYNMKPHWFGSAHAFAEGKALDGFYLEGRDSIVGRVDGQVVRLDVDRTTGQAVYDDGLAKVTVALSPSGPTLVGFDVARAPSGHEVRGDRIVVLAALLDGVLSTVNPVSAALS